MTFGEWLEDCLREREIPRSEFVRELDYAPSTVSRWLRGAEPSASAIIKIAGVLALDPREVLYRAAGLPPDGNVSPRSDDDVALAVEAARLMSQADKLAKALANRARERHARDDESRAHR